MGVSLKKEGLENTKILSVLNSLAQLPLDYESARVGGKIFGKKIQVGSRIDPEDAMLAGISRVNQQPVITRNIRDFSESSSKPIDNNESLNFLVQ